MKPIFAFDIDGTLTHRHDWIAPNVVSKLRLLHDSGYPVILVTGRIFSFAKKVLCYFDFPYILAVQNGADIIQMPSEKKLGRYYFESSLICDIDLAYSGYQEDFIVYSGIDHGDFCYYRPERFSKKMIDYLKKLKSLVELPWQASDFSFTSKTFPLVKCFGSYEDMTQIKAKLLNNSQFEVSMIRDPIDPKLYLNLITHPMANKGNVIDFIRICYPDSKIIAAGNDFNDLKMLEKADIAIAVNTAPKEVCAVGDILADPPEKGGILKAIEEALAFAN